MLEAKPSAPYEVVGPTRGFPRLLRSRFAVPNSWSPPLPVIGVFTAPLFLSYGFLFLFFSCHIFLYVFSQRCVY